MKTSRKVAGGSEIRALPALTPEGREARCIGYAMDLVEQRLLNGTASSQETCFFLKLGLKERELELKSMEAENELKIAKAEQIRSTKENTALYQEALKAFRRYSAQSDDGE